VTSSYRGPLALLLALVIAACADKQQPAGELLGQVQVAVVAGAEDESRYLPDEFRALEARLAALQSAFDGKRYEVVLADGPAVLAAARTIGAEAAARKSAATAALSANWTQLAATLPDRLMGLGQRLEAEKPVSGIDVPAARRALHDANSLWSKARSAFASGNLTEAVRTAQDVAAQVDVLTTRLKPERVPDAKAAVAAVRRR